MALDPADAATILSNAMMVYVKINGRRSKLGDLTKNELDCVRQGRGRADGHTFARKYAKIIADLRDLEDDIAHCAPRELLLLEPEVVPMTAKATAAAAASAAKAATAFSAPGTPEPTPAPCLTIVPYVDTARPHACVQPTVLDFSAWPLDAMRRYLRFLRNSLAWRTYCALFRYTVHAVLYIPIICMWVLIFYTLLLLTHVITQPQVLVSALFQGASLIPQYGAWAGQQMLEQLKLEIVSSLR
jgi:hypothetical protein